MADDKTTAEHAAEHKYGGNTLNFAGDEDRRLATIAAFVAGAVWQREKDAQLAEGYRRGDQLLAGHGKPVHEARNAIAFVIRGDGNDQTVEDAERASDFMAIAFHDTLQQLAPDFEDRPAAYVEWMSLSESRRQHLAATFDALSRSGLIPPEPRGHVTVTPSPENDAALARALAKHRGEEWAWDDDDSNDDPQAIATRRNWLALVRWLRSQGLLGLSAEQVWDEGHKAGDAHPWTVTNPYRTAAGA